MGHDKFCKLSSCEIFISTRQSNRLGYKQKYVSEYVIISGGDTICSGKKHSAVSSFKFKGYCATSINLQGSSSNSNSVLSSINCSRLISKGKSLISFTIGDSITISIKSDCYSSSFFGKKFTSWGWSNVDYSIRDSVGRLSQFKSLIPLLPCSKPMSNSILSLTNFLTSYSTNSNWSSTISSFK